MASDHYYFLGSGRAGEKNPPATRARFLSNSLHDNYEKAYARVGAVLAAQGVPYRIDEMNSCYNGGGKGFERHLRVHLMGAGLHALVGGASHSGHELSHGGIGGAGWTFGAANYAAFVHQADGNGFNMRPQAYAYLAFSQGAHGRPLGVKIQTAPAFDFNAYAYRDQGRLHLCDPDQQELWRQGATGVGFPPVAPRHGLGNMATNGSGAEGPGRRRQNGH